MIVMEFPVRAFSHLLHAAVTVDSFLVVAIIVVFSVNAASFFYISSSFV